MDTETLPTESHPEAAEILRAAGWAPHPTWGVFTRGPLVMGGPGDGAFHIKNTAMAPDSPDTPDDPVAAARWLVARFAVAEQSEAAEARPSYGAGSIEEYYEALNHEAHEETGAEAAGDGSALDGGDEGGFSGFDILDPAVVVGEPELHAANAELGVDDGCGESGSGSALLGEPSPSPTDADFSEQSLGAEILLDDYGDGADPLLTYTEAEGEEAIAEPEHAAGAFIFGDNLHQMRTAAIGLVVQISLAKQDAIWEVSGTTEAAYEHLVSQVMRDTRDGMYIGPPEAFTKFTELQQWANRAASVKKAERLRVALLLNASREEIEMFDPEADWP